MSEHLDRINYLLDQNPDVLKQLEALPIDAAPAAQDQAPEFSEDALALTFTAQHGDNLRYVAAWGRWLKWDGSRWAFDDTLHVFDRARDICRKAAAECEEKPGTAARLASAVTVAAVERLARADRKHAATIGQWDADPWLLNTPSAVVDLRTGNVRENRRGDYCTKITAAKVGGACPQWRAFLDRVTAGSDELQAFLQRMAGYCLTGNTREHALFFLYGTGANGKTVFVSTLAGILGDYAKTAAIETFVVSTNEGHPTNLAALQGARLVTAVETEDGRRWAESKLKALTGGDRIAARFMRQDFFEFVPVFKLVLAGNHKPGLRSVDEAMRRRLHLIPFTVTIPPAERDLQLTEKLRGEWAGILEWMVDGCLQWHREELNPPAIVRDATEAYLSAEDAIEQWMEQNCVTGKECLATAGTLFANWKAWCEGSGEHVGSQKRFSQKLEDRGLIRNRCGPNATRAFRGIAMKTKGD